MALISKSSNKRVPVKNRRSNAKETSATPKAVAAELRVGPVELIVLISVLIIFLLTIALPLRNYFQQRNEINEVTAAIEQKKERKEELLGELERYRSPAYIEEQARNRLGVVSKGEVAFRILDPTMLQEDTLTSPTDGDDANQSKWYNTLWTSIIDPNELVAEEQTAESSPEMKMPVEPTEPVMPQP